MQKKAINGFNDKLSELQETFEKFMFTADERSEEDCQTVESVIRFLRCGILALNERMEEQKKPRLYILPD